MTGQEALFDTPEETRIKEAIAERQRIHDYLASLDGCPFCGQPESGPWMYMNNHGYYMGDWPQYVDGSGCSRLHLLGNQAKYAARRDDGTWLDRYNEITRYKSNATHWPADWFNELEAELREIGVLA